RSSGQPVLLRRDQREDRPYVQEVDVEVVGTDRIRRRGALGPAALFFGRLISYGDSLAARASRPTGSEIATGLPRDSFKVRSASGQLIRTGRLRVAATRT